MKLVVFVIIMERVSKGEIPGVVEGSVSVKVSQRKSIQKESRGNYRVPGRKPFLMALIVLAVLGVAVYCRVSYVQAVEAAYEEQEQQLEALIEEEEKRSQELIEYEARMDTDEFIAEIAESRLGLVHKGEVIFRSTQE